MSVRGESGLVGKLMKNPVESRPVSSSMMSGRL